MTQAILLLSITNVALAILAAWQRHVTVREVRHKQAKRARKTTRRAREGQGGRAVE